MNELQVNDPRQMSGAFEGCMWISNTFCYSGMYKKAGGTELV